MIIENPSSMLAITSYYNPFRGALRKKNYDTFRKFLGLNLMTVEWSPEGIFDLCENDADHLIQVSGGDFIWQKERLLNIGLQRAKDLGFSRLAFLDCDIIFTNPKWFESVNTALESQPIIQCFSNLNYLPPLNFADIDRKKIAEVKPELTRNSLAFELDMSGDFINRKPELWPLSGNPGMTLAVNIAKKATFEYYEFNIVGGGDSVLAAGASNRLIEEFSRNLYTPEHERSIRKWHEKIFSSTDRLGYVKNEINHLWHGNLDDRQYMDRHNILLRNKYNPELDIEKEKDCPIKMDIKKIKMRDEIKKYLFSRSDF